jgi:AAA domain/Bifunctional DNA primase/polymerase, N-terminal
MASPGWEEGAYLVSIPNGTTNGYSDALADAHALVDLGIPVFAGRLDDEGNPDRLDNRWKNWQDKKPSHRLVDSWRQGDALCAVAGYAYDVLDYDPRNGGEMSLARLSRDLDEDGPEVYWRVSTPSGGQHLYVAALGIGKHTGFLPGLDLQGGKPDGSGRGFVFLPPTVRPSKETGERAGYLALTPLDKPEDPPCEPLKTYIEKCLEEKVSVKPDDGPTLGRTAISSLKAEALAAGAGEQRMALLRLVHEYERRGYDEDDIIELLIPLVQAMPVYDEKRPWYPVKGKRPDAELIGLLHHAGAVIPDATPEEMAGDFEPIRMSLSGLVQSLANVPVKLVKWIWRSYLPRGEFTILDGEKGQGKSFVVADIIARGTNGDPMPGREEADCGPFNAIIFTHEGKAAVEPRLRAAGADMKRVFIPVLPKPKRGKEQSTDPLALPGGAEMIAKMIIEANAELAIFDPITDFLDETIMTHNDASVRRALNPLGIKLETIGCAGLGLRHMNKSRDADAKMRGAGSTAFQNRARVHLVSGEIEPKPDGTRCFGIGMADINDVKRVGGALVYSVVDSNVKLDDVGNLVGRVEWDGYADIDVNDLTRGYDHRKDGHGGRKPLMQELAEQVMDDLLPTAGEIAAVDAIAALKEAGCSTSPSVLLKVRANLGIRSTRIPKRGKPGVMKWVWVRD